MDLSSVINYFEFKKIFGIAGNTASILSFIISILVWLSVKKIREFYVFNARSPAFTQKLSKLASNLSEGLNSYEGITTKIKKNLVEIDITLKSLRKNSNSEVKATINVLIKNIKKAESNNDHEVSKELLENIHIMTYKVIKQCEERYEESRWER